MAQVQNPHDSLFKATFSDLTRAAEEIRHLFAPEIVERMDLSTLSLETASLVDERLHQRHVDMLYSLQIAGERALVYVLLEHKSSHDPWLPLWLLIYMTRIWESLHGRGELTPGRLPPILPAVVFHGEKGWQGSTQFEAIYALPPDTPDALWAHIPRFRFALDDLTATSAEALRERTVSMATRLVLAALREVRTIPSAVLLVRGLADLMRGSRHDPGVLRRVIEYISAVRGAEECRAIIDILAAEVGPEEEGMMLTIREAWVQEGEQRGEQRGRLTGQRETLVRQLRKRFGDLPAAVLARIDSADETTLERWSEDLLDARELAALFPTQ